MKTQHTAIVIIPPANVWGPIQDVRRQLDPHEREWMPHLTLLHPFRPRTEFPAIAPELKRVCAGVAPFAVQLHKIRHFHHGGVRNTLWLDAVPRAPIVSLQELLLLIVPDCADTRRHPDGFVPHLSLGQIQGRKALYESKRLLRDTWRPLNFTVNAIQLVWQPAPPEDIFQVEVEIPLGGSRLT